MALFALLGILASAGACSSKSSIENPTGGSGGAGGADASAGVGGVGGNAGGSTGGAAGGAGSSGSGGAGGSGGSAGASGSGGSGGSKCKANGFAFLPDPPKGGSFEVTYTDVAQHEDVRLDVACKSGTGTVQFIKNSGDCQVAGPPPCNWHFQVTGCGPGPATIGFYKDAKEGGSGMKVTECTVQLL